MRQGQLFSTGVQSGLGLGVSRSFEKHIGRVEDLSEQ